MTFDWATAPGTATAGVDYVTASGSRTIAAGATSATIAITVNGDVAGRGRTRPSRVALSNPAERHDRRRIGDRHRSPTTTRLRACRSTTSPSRRATPGTTTATFTVSLSAASGKTVTFDWATAAGTATAGVDYVTASGSRTIAAGATSATIAITVNGDVVDEADETFTRHAVEPRERHDRRRVCPGHHHRRRRGAQPLGERRLRHRGQRGDHHRHVHRLPLGGERERRDVRLGHRPGHGHRGGGLRDRQRQPHDRRRRHQRHDRDHRER